MTLPARVIPFTARLAARRARWWGIPFRWGSLAAYADALHRRREVRARRRAEDPDDRWRCCEAWPRALVQKWNGREFARRFGARLPELLWSGPRGEVPLEALPPRFALRPLTGRFRKGAHVVVDGRELLRGGAASPDELRRRLRAEGPRTPVLVEAFVPRGPDDPRLPLELKCHTFGPRLGVFELIERRGATAGAARFYTLAWEPIEDPVSLGIEPAPPRPPPAGLEAARDLAERLGAAIGTFMRIDFFATPAGPVFNEFSSTPIRNEHGFTPYGEELLGRLWEEHCPGKI
ncbi:MAG TPA: hypothetical protein VHF22_13835 [Planctomycetota bacterium]|nr:hypothetical protein [Planctomycetota bacterium]